MKYHDTLSRSSQIHREIGELCFRRFKSNSIQYTYDEFDALEYIWREVIGHAGSQTYTQKSDKVLITQLYVVIGYNMLKRMERLIAQRDPSRRDNPTQRYTYYHDEAIVYLQLMSMYRHQFSLGQNAIIDIAYLPLSYSYF